MAEPYRHSIEVDAAPARVFEYFTKPDAILKWMGEYALLDPTPGGEFTLDINGMPVRGRYVELDPPRRIVLTWGYAGSDILPPGASTVVVTFTPTSTGTAVELEHHGLPEPEAAMHAVGWPHFLGRLGDALGPAGRAPVMG